MTEQQSNILKIAAIVVLLFIGTKVYRKTRGKKIVLMRKNFTEQDAVKALKAAEKKFGTDAAALLERVMRWETAHFTSGQYKRTGSPGMEIGGSNKSYPYGWVTPVGLWEKNPQYKPIGTYTTPENQTGKIKTFIKFPSVEAAVMTLGEVLKNRNWNAGSWYSTNPTSQKLYNDKINKVRNRIIV